MKRLFCVLLTGVLACSLVGCGGNSAESYGSSSTDSASSFASSSASEVSVMASSAAPVGPVFAEGEPAYKSWEDGQGYAVSVSVKTWVGQKGTGNEIVHPADSSVVLPSSETTNCIIPFQFTLTNTTASSGYKADMNFKTRSIGTTGKGSEHFIIAAGSDDWISAASGSSISRKYSDTSKGFSTTWYGFVKIISYYTPKYEDGDTSGIKGNHFVISSGYTGTYPLAFNLVPEGDVLTLVVDEAYF